MKRLIAITLFSGFIITTSCFNKSGSPNVETPKLNSDSHIVRGEYLVNAIGCDDCHSPKQNGPFGPEIIEELRLSGFRSESIIPEVNLEALEAGWVLFTQDGTASVGPWGTSFAGNLTSDPTGIGNWSEENFITAIRKGKLKGIDNARNLLPPMPWTVYKTMTDEDLKSIFAFLKSTRPVQNTVPPPVSLETLIAKK